MKTNVQNILKKGGYTPIFTSIVKAIEDLHRLGESKEEIKSCLMECYSDGEKIDDFIDDQISKLN